jgi:hypothetical protein
MRDKKVNTDPELYNQLKEENLRFKFFFFKRSFSVDTVSSLEEDAFLDFKQQVVEKKASKLNSTRFYISSSEISVCSAYEANDDITYRRNTL